MIFFEESNDIITDGTIIKLLLSLLFIIIRSIMSNVHNDSRVVSLTSRQGLATTLDTMVDQLNRCQKALNEFLEVLLETTVYNGNIYIYMYMYMYKLYSVKQTIYIHVYLLNLLQAVLVNLLY